MGFTTLWELQLEDIGEHFLPVFAQITRDWCLLIDCAVRQSQLPCNEVSCQAKGLIMHRESATFYRSSAPEKARPASLYASKRQPPGVRRCSSHQIQAEAFGPSAAYILLVFQSSFKFCVVQADSSHSVPAHYEHWKRFDWKS
jgi:hypothetical protein